MSRHQDAARSSCGWLVLRLPVRRWMVSLVTDVPSGSALNRTRATVCTVPVGFVAHVYQLLVWLLTRGSLRVAGLTRSRNSTSCALDVAVPVTRAAARPI